MKLTVTLPDDAAVNAGVRPALSRILSKSEPPFLQATEKQIF